MRRSRKSERKLRAVTRRPRRWRCTSSGKMSPSASTVRPASGSSNPAESAPTRISTALSGPDREAVLGEQVAETIGAAVVAEEEEAAAGGVPQVSGEGADVAGVVPHGPRARRGCRGLRDPPRAGGGPGRQESRSRSRSRPTSASSGSRTRPVHAGMVLPGPFPVGLGFGIDGLRDRGRPRAAVFRCSKGGTVAPGTRGRSSTRSSGGRPRSRDSRMAATSGASGKRRGRRSRSAARVERVAKRSERGRAVTLSAGARVRWVSGSNERRLSMVSP